MFLCAQSFACQLKIYPDFYAGIRKIIRIFQLDSRFLFECLEWKIDCNSLSWYKFRRKSCVRRGYFSKTSFKLNERSFVYKSLLAWQSPSCLEKSRPNLRVKYMEFIPKKSKLDNFYIFTGHSKRVRFHRHRREEGLLGWKTVLDFIHDLMVWCYGTFWLLGLGLSYDQGSCVVFLVKTLNPLL